jgi:hypothetical protein
LAALLFPDIEDDPLALPDRAQLVLLAMALSELLVAPLAALCAAVDPFTQWSLFDMLPLPFAAPALGVMPTVAFEPVLVPALLWAKAATGARANVATASRHLTFMNVPPVVCARATRR